MYCKKNHIDVQYMNQGLQRSKIIHTVQAMLQFAADYTGLLWPYNDAVELVSDWTFID